MKIKKKLFLALSLPALFLLVQMYFKASEPRSIDLSAFEETVYSQNGEDGVIRKIFKTIGTGSKFFVEFGGHDGRAMSNTRNLRKHHHWKGLLFDCEHENLKIHLHKELITADNINTVFEKYKVPHHLDLLSIDIDYNDFYVWKALDDKYRPRLVVIEYNASHLPTEDKVVEYNPAYFWDGSNYYGASILALYNLAREKGYSLIYAENRGVNLFFLRDDLIDERKLYFKDMNNVKNIYKFPSYNVGPLGGHPQDPFDRPYVSSNLLLNKPQKDVR